MGFSHDSSNMRVAKEKCLQFRGTQTSLVLLLWSLPKVYRGCQGALCPPLRFNYQAHWLFNLSLILFNWRQGRHSSCHLGESGTEKAAMMICKLQDGRTKAGRSAASSSGRWPKFSPLFQMNLRCAATTLHKMKLDQHLCSLQGSPTVFFFFFAFFFLFSFFLRAENNSEAYAWHTP